MQCNKIICSEQRMTKINRYVLTRDLRTEQGRYWSSSSTMRMNTHSKFPIDSRLAMCQVVIGVGEDDMAGRKSCQESSAGRSVIAMYTTMYEVLCVDASSCWCVVRSSSNRMLRWRKLRRRFTLGGNSCWLPSILPCLSYGINNLLSSIVSILS